MMRPLVKVCGVTRLEDAQAAVQAGASAIGFVLVPSSPRCVSAEKAHAIASELPNGIARVGVVIGCDPDEVRSLVRSIGLSAIQAHGDETAEECRAYGLPVVKAVTAGTDFDVASLAPYREFPVLLDGSSLTARGGTGKTANWTGARAARDAGYRVLLAGGLAADNVLEAARQVEPEAVDLNSGVETSPGIKDAERIRQAIDRLSALDPPEEMIWPW